MKISVVLPSYNVAPWIGQALKSVANQRLAPHEIIVIDDGSTDETLAEIKSTGIDIKLLHSKGGNAAAARNVGIQAASGDWIAFQDGDDFWYPDHLERAASLLKDTTNVGYLGASDVLMPDKNIYKGVNPFPHSAPAGCLDGMTYINYFSKFRYFCTPACLAKRETLFEVGCFDPRLTHLEDVDMWLRLIHGRAWIYDPQATCAFRPTRKGSLTSNFVSYEYFQFIALKKNEARYDSHEMQQLLKISARRAVSEAWTNGTLKDRNRALNSTTPFLSKQDRRLFTTLKFCPFIFRWANWVRRKFRGLPPPGLTPAITGQLVEVPNE